MTVTLAASVAATFLLSVMAALVAAAPSSAAVAGPFDDQRTPAALRNLDVLSSVGELNDAEDGRFVGLTHTGNGIDQEEPEMVEEDGASVASIFEAQKRPWGKTNMPLWGKRHASFPVAEDESIEKRKWGQKNMALWGKRSSDDYFRFPVELYPSAISAAEKRKWGQKNMALWGR